MNFENIRFLLENRAPNLTDSKKKTIGWVVRKRWTTYMV